MDYFTLTNYLSEKLGIDKEIFQLEFPYPIGSDLDQIQNQDFKNHYYLSSYEYWANTKERWRSIKLFFPKELKCEVILIFNEYLKAEGEKEIEVDDIPEEFSRDQEGFNLVLGQNTNYLILEIALKEN